MNQNIKRDNQKNRKRQLHKNEKKKSLKLSFVSQFTSLKL